MSISRYEQETIISFNNDSNIAIIYSCSLPFLNKMKKNKAAKVTHVFKDGKGKIIGKEFEINKRFICIRSKTRKPNLTDEQRKKIGERLNKSLKRKRKNKG